MRDILSFLSPFGITAKKAVKIYKAFGVRSMDVLKKTPFELCTLSGFGFKTVDAIARKTPADLTIPCGYVVPYIISWMR